LRNFFLSTIVWKCFLALLLVAAAGLIAMGIRHSPDLLGPAVIGDLGLKAKPVEVFASRSMLVEALTADSPLAAAGVRVGDHIEFERYNDFKGSAEPGESVAFMLHRPGSTLPLSVKTVARQSKPDLAFIVLNLVYFCVGMVFAALVGFKRADSLACRALAFFFVGTVFTGVFWIAGLGTNLTWARHANAAFALTWSALALFAILYPEDRPSHLRATLARHFGWYVAAVLVATLMRVARGFGYYIPGMATTSIVLAIATLLLILAALRDGWRNSQGETRQRQLWLFAALGPFAFVAQLAIFPSLFSPELYHDYHYVQRSWAIVAYVGLAYAVLRYRVFNFGFAVNRAVLFTIISTLLLIVFAIVEFTVDKLLHFHGRQANIIIDAMVALGVILSFHRIQHWVSHKVDHTFFKHWHDASRRLRHFINTAVHINDTTTLLDRFVTAVDLFAGGTGTAVYSRAADGHFVLRHTSLDSAPPQVDANAPLLLELQHAQGVLDTVNAGPAYGAALAIPMSVRGIINGMVLVGARRDRQQYRPDQLEQLGEAARHLGLDLEGLRVDELEAEGRQLAQRGALLEHEAKVLRAIVMDASLNTGSREVLT
jgi:hypothetical protein